jgi:hypothetical protein
MYKLFNPSSAPLKMEHGDDDLLHIIDDLIKENAILRQQRDEFSSKVIFLEDRYNSVDNDANHMPKFCNNCAAMRDELFLAQLELQQRGSAPVHATIHQFQTNLKSVSTSKSLTVDTTVGTQLSDTEDIMDATKERIDMYESVCANLEEYEGQIRTLSISMIHLESDNARKHFSSFLQHNIFRLIHFVSLR